MGYPQFRKPPCGKGSLHADIRAPHIIQPHAEGNKRWHDPCREETAMRLSRLTAFGAVCWQPKGLVGLESLEWIYKPLFFQWFMWVHNSHSSQWHLWCRATYNTTWQMANVNSGLTTSARRSIDLVGHQLCYVVMWYTQGWDFYHPQSW